MLRMDIRWVTAVVIACGEVDPRLGVITQVIGPRATDARLRLELNNRPYVLDYAFESDPSTVKRPPQIVP